MDNNTVKTVFKEYIYPLNSKVIQKMIDHAKIDKYVKKLDVLKFTNLFIYAQLQGLPSLRRISEKVKRKKSVQRQVGLESISKLQLSQKLGDIPPEIFQVIMRHLVQKLYLSIRPKKADKALGKIYLIDSSTTSMCLSQYEWTDFRTAKPDVKMHISIEFCDGEHYLNKMKHPLPDRNIG